MHGTAEDGQPLEVLLNEHGTISRGNHGAPIEAWLGKIAAKTGRSHKVAGFGEIADLRAYAQM